MLCVRGTVVAAIVVGALVSPTNARAQCPTEPSLSQRQAFVDKAIDRGARQGRTWAGLWGGSFGVAAVGAVTIASVIDDRGWSIDLYVSGGAAALGALSRAVLMPALVRKRRGYRKRVAQGLRGCERLQAAERVLVTGARGERRARSVAMHLAALTVSASTGVILGLGFNRPISGNRQFMIGAAVGQVMLLTMPKPATVALARYRRTTLSGLQAVPLGLLGGGGAAVRGSF